MFYTAVVCYCWGTPEQESRIAIGSVLGVLLFFFLAYVWIITESSGYTWAGWWGGLRVPSRISRALRAFLRDVVVLFRVRLHPYFTNHVSSEQELAGHQDDVVGGEA